MVRGMLLWTFSPPNAIQSGSEECRDRQRLQPRREDLRSLGPDILDRHKPEHEAATHDVPLARHQLPE